jgi:hypothetical protein
MHYTASIHAKLAAISGASCDTDSYGLGYLVTRLRRFRDKILYVN